MNSAYMRQILADNIKVFVDTRHDLNLDWEKCHKQIATELFVTLSTPSIYGFKNPSSLDEIVSFTKFKDFCLSLYWHSLRSGATSDLIRQLMSSKFIQCVIYASKIQNFGKLVGDQGVGCATLCADRYVVVKGFNNDTSATYRNDENAVTNKLELIVNQLAKELPEILNQEARVRSRPIYRHKPSHGVGHIYGRTVSFSVNIDGTFSVRLSKLDDKHRYKGKRTIRKINDHTNQDVLSILKRVLRDTTIFIPSNTHTETDTAIVFDVSIRPTGDNALIGKISTFDATAVVSVDPVSVKIGKLKAEIAINDDLKDRLKKELRAAVVDGNKMQEDLEVLFKAQEILVS